MNKSKLCFGYLEIVHFYVFWQLSHVLTDFQLFIPENG